MKTRVFFIILLFLAGVMQGHAQSDQKSSGKLQLNMSKKKEVQPLERNVSSTKFKIEKPQPVNTSAASSTVNARNEISWVSPSVNAINTARNTYTLQARVTANENLSVVNIFINEEFYKNIIVRSSQGNQVDIEETVELSLGSNVIRMEGVTINGNKVEDKVYINYDLSSARYYALIIAVQDYDDPTINDLSEPINDANRFYRIISSKYTFNQEDITYLKNPTKADIIGTLHNMRGKVGEEDNLLIYYAGHGYWDEEMMTGYWLPSDAESSNPVNWLPNTDLTNYLNVLKTKHTLLIADACFSGGIFKTRKAFNNMGTIEKLYRLPSRKAITSGNLKEVPDESWFIHYLLKNLDGNNEKYLSSEQLFSQIRLPVMNQSDNVPQYGTIQKVGDEGGDFVFIMR